MDVKDKFLGSMLGEALGDAFGFPISIYREEQINQYYGPLGPKTLRLDDTNHIALISDDTQITLFTAEGLLWAKHRIKKMGTANIASCCFYSYLRWLHTQGYRPADESDQWVLDEKRFEVKTNLLNERVLFAKRNPDVETIETLTNIYNQDYGTIEVPINNNNSYGGLQRVVPIGLCFYQSPRSAFDIGTQVAAITHSNPTAYLSAGAYCALLAYIVKGCSFSEAISMTLNLLSRFAASTKVSDAISAATTLAAVGYPTRTKVQTFGSGQDASEALAIALYCALSYPDDLMKAIALASNHSGLSDTTAALCGALVGARLGKVDSLQPMYDLVEGSDIVTRLAIDLYDKFSH